MTLEERIKNKKLKQDKVGEYFNPKLSLSIPYYKTNKATGKTELAHKQVRGVTLNFPDPINQNTWKVTWTSRGKPNEKYLYSSRETNTQYEPHLVKGCYQYSVLPGKIGKREYLLYVHRALYFAYYEETERMQIHHINKVPYDNSLQNLVALTEQEHSQIHGHSTHVPGSYRKLF